MRYTNSLCAGAVFSATLLTGAAHAGQITADPEAIMSAMQDYGFVATLETDSDGDPKIVSRVSQTKFRVYFFGCKDNVDCASVHFRAGYDLDEPTNALKVNEWNRENRFAKTYIDDEGDPFLEYDVNLDFDGVGEKNFEDSLDWWRLVVEDFEEHIDW